MSWQVLVRPEVEQDIAETALWYEARQPGLGTEFVEEVMRVWDALLENPFLNSRRHPQKNIRWRYSQRFPYRVIYEIFEKEQTVVIAAVLHAARHHRHWQVRME